MHDFDNKHPTRQDMNPVRLRFEPQPEKMRHRDRLLLIFKLLLHFSIYVIRHVKHSKFKPLYFVCLGKVVAYVVFYFFPCVLEDAGRLRLVLL